LSQVLNFFFKCPKKQKKDKDFQVC